MLAERGERLAARRSVTTCDSDGIYSAGLGVNALAGACAMVYTIFINIYTMAIALRN